ncbi:MAG: transposase, partial [candidate division Zixibacteria bacterium]|nr:transposase [candidate division Zixibacteria bacterium]
MSKLLRYFAPSQTVFVTSVTVNRHPILLGNEDLLVKAFGQILGGAQEHLPAWVILPDHFHAIILSVGFDVPAVMKKLKLIFSYHYRARHSLYRGTLWQSRYWDHVVRNEEDLN